MTMRQDQNARTSELPSDMDLRKDPIFIGIGARFSRIRSERVGELRTLYRIKGLKETGGDIRPSLNLCNIGHEDMFDGQFPKVGDVVALGYLYGDDAAHALICRLGERYEWNERPQCTELGMRYRFEWRVEPISEHEFPAVPG